MSYIIHRCTKEGAERYIPHQSALNAEETDGIPYSDCSQMISLGFVNDMESGFSEFDLSFVEFGFEFLEWSLGNDVKI